jgi:hypothetical protein
MFDLDAFGPLFGYGPAPGLELIPYFLALLAWAGFAVVAVLVSPFSAVLRRLRRAKKPPQPEPQNTPVAASARESFGECSHNSA